MKYPKKNYLVELHSFAITISSRGLYLGLYFLLYHNRKFMVKSIVIKVLSCLFILIYI